MSKITLSGSSKPTVGVTSPIQLDPQLVIPVTFLLRRGAGYVSLQDHATKVINGKQALLSRTEFADKFSADPTEIATVRTVVQQYGLTVIDVNPVTRSVKVSGTVAQFNAMFEISLYNLEFNYVLYRGYQGTLQIPSELGSIVHHVLGLDTRPLVSPYIHSLATSTTSYTPLQLATAYNFPSGTGAGQCIGIIELGGGYQTSDLNTYFSSLSLSTPTVTAIAVDGGANTPVGNVDSADGEVCLDIEVAGAIAPAAHLAVYFTTNTDSGFLDAITTAIHDTVNNPSVISISWGGPENSWTAADMTAYDDAFQTAVALGVTVCVAAGDSGSSDGSSGSNVDFPASSPHVLACGGTSLRTTNNAISSETVWNDSTSSATGGGISKTFAVPSYQTGLSAALTAGGVTALTKRGVPDVAACADPDTGYVVQVDGESTVFGGTSAVAPLFAGLIARINSIKNTKMGFVNTLFYSNPTAFNDVTSGNNGTYKAVAGWDACSGLGSPNGAKIANLVNGTTTPVPTLAPTLPPITQAPTEAPTLPPTEAPTLPPVTTEAPTTSAPTPVPTEAPTPVPTPVTTTAAPTEPVATTPVPTHPVHTPKPTPRPTTPAPTTPAPTPVPPVHKKHKRHRKHHHPFWPGRGPRP